MHELTLCEALLDLLDEECAQRGFRSLARVRIEIGRFGCVDPDALAYSFEVTTRGGWLEGVELVVDRPPGLVTCLDCGTESPVEDRFADCPRCGGSRLLPTGGDEMRLVEIEVRY